jgi:hypothetical protein
MSTELKVVEVAAREVRFQATSPRFRHRFSYMLVGQGLLPTRLLVVSTVVERLAMATAIRVLVVELPTFARRRTFPTELWLQAAVAAPEVGLVVLAALAGSPSPLWEPKVQLQLPAVAEELRPQVALEVLV